MFLLDNKNFENYMFDSQFIFECNRNNSFQLQKAMQTSPKKEKGKKSYIASQWPKHHSTSIIKTLNV